MIAAGIGCRKGVRPAEIESILAAALETFGVDRSELAAVATEQSKGDDTALREVAVNMAVPLRLYPVARLDEVSHLILTASQRVQELKGVASVAEAAALLAAGRNARLLGPRIATASATCALARGDGFIGEAASQS